MAALLRKVTHSIHAKAPTVDQLTSDSNITLPAPSSDPCNKGPYLSTNRESESTRSLVSRNHHTVQALEQDNPPTLLRGIRDRLARKASTLSLRSKHRRGVLRRSGENNARAHTLFAFEKDTQTYKPENTSRRSASPATVISDTDAAPPPPPIKTRDSASFPNSKFAADIFASSASSRKVTFDSGAGDEFNVQQNYQRLKERHLASQVENNVNITWVKMASEQVAPPVSYERLRQVTTEACDTALSSVKVYRHADTESWNTQIINSILATLVKESASSTSGPTSQPSFKFVVNATIIQHASGSTAGSDDAAKSAGRRGMHSASGAYWNNEKDGMWSFKYEAAEAKGLDVVVGIIWIWVG